MPLFSEFSVANRWWDGLWGGGHTAATDPTRHGWRAALSHKDGAALVIGRRNHRGCASAVPTATSGFLLVAVYDATPEEIAGCLREGRPTPLAKTAFLTPSTPGWGLGVLERI